MLFLINRGVILLLLFLMSFWHFVAVGQVVDKFLPEQTRLSVDITKPEDFLGFDLGERHIRHDQVLGYLQQITAQSNRIQLTQMGRTNEFRSQVLLTISSEENLANLDAILARRQLLHESSEDPIVVWLGYSIHGDEISGANAALILAYYFAAVQNQEIVNLLKDVIVVIEPTINPDGMDRFVNWVTTYRGMTDNDDPNHIEHHQGWRTGRTNHFGFDLNRDWLLLSQIESQNRLPFYHQYQPNILGDFHEMGANSSYFFQPGVPTRTHPLTPKKNTELTSLLATFHANALDAKQRLYYSKENFDDFYYGKGSTYPDINGGVGVLFEQASSRGYQQQTVNGLLTFEYGIENHLMTSLSTIQGAWRNKAKFKQYRQKFYQEAKQVAEDEDFNGYIFTEEKDLSRLHSFLYKLKQHQIRIYQLSRDFRIDDHVYRAEHSYFIPLVQKQYRVIEALFNQQKNFRDNTFYDVSGWTLPLAMDIKFAKVDSTRGLKTKELKFKSQAIKRDVSTKTSVAYAFRWFDFNSPKLLYKLLKLGIKAKVSTKAFSSISEGKPAEFDTGTIVLSSANQTKDNWQQVIIELAANHNITLFPLDSGLSIKGVDLGSGSFKPLALPKILLIGGKGVSQYESADVLFYLDNLMAMPVTIVEMDRLDKIRLSQYSHVLMVDGKYNQLSKKSVDKLENWLRDGGVVFAQKNAAKWLSTQELLNVDFVNKNEIDALFSTKQLTYDQKEALAARKRIAGAIFHIDIDLSHPLFYGYQSSQLAFFRNSTIMMESVKTPFISLAHYSDAPLLSGYTDQNLVNRLANSPVLVAHNFEKGRVIATTDNLAFRGYFLGSMKIIANSLFFAKAFTVTQAE